jgi:protein gp37
VATKSSIEWTQVTWNPVTGCSKVSQGCKHCYAERMAKRLHAMGANRYKNGFLPTLHDDLIDLPRSWKAPKLIFVNSMSDLFHDAVPDGFIQRLFETMRACPQHTFQVLTKRSKRLRAIGQEIDWPENVWMGVSVENSKAAERVLDLSNVPAKVRFLSCEPLLGPLNDLPLCGIHWVITGGESGPGARPMQPEWVVSIKDQCRAAGVPFFFKQWGGVWKKRTGRSLHGRTYSEMPRLSARERSDLVPLQVLQ